MGEKYAIITFHDTTNFGSTLQSYALCKACRMVGMECEILDYKAEAIINRELGKTTNHQSLLKRTIKYLLFGRTQQIKHKNMLTFLQGMLSDKSYVRRDLQSANEYYDAFIVGSDIVWGMDITKGDYSFFLDFVEEKKKKFAFSSSVGDFWNVEYHSEIGKYLGRFESICVREDESAKWIKDLFDIKVDVVCDPTMLIETSEWRKFVKNSAVQKRYVLVYFGNDSILEEAQKYGKRKRIEVFFINYGLPKKNVKNIRPKTVEEFLGLICNAQAVYTGSYHGLLFSVYFHKQFVVYNRAHASRFNTLLNRLKLQDRLMGTCDMDDIIDYDSVDKLVQEFRENSFRMLKLMRGRDD